MLKQIDDKLNFYLENLLEMLKEGVIGFYNQIEIVTVFGIKKGQSDPFNVLTLLVAEETKKVELIQEQLLSKKLIEIKGIKDIKFGVIKYSICVNDLHHLLVTLLDDKCWNGLGKKLLLSKDITFTPKSFIPANSYLDVPLNNILKNNFYNGSYVFEVFDLNKQELMFLFNNPNLLQSLSEKVREIIPIKIGSISDRLGNIVIQLPIQILMTDISHSRENNDFILESVWHPKSQPRDLRITCIREDDLNYPDFFSSVVEKNTSSLLIPMNHEMYPYRYYLWDDKYKLLLGASANSSFLRSIGFSGSIIEQEPRLFYFDDDNDLKNQQRVGVVNNQDWSVGKENKNCDKIDILKKERLYSSEKKDLQITKNFIQYKNNSNQAYQDIRYLISKYGQKGICLWDPYLSAGDILKTLFFCGYYGSKQRAITGLKAYDDSDSEKKSKKVSLMQKYRHDLNYFGGNKFGLNLEFRAKHGQKGWSFHDRFLIFPKTEQGTLAWSLGTSVNSLGREHHIFQKVSDGQMILDAFEELWGELSDEEYLVWKS